MYEQYKGRPDLTGIQERLVFLVHLRKKHIRLLEMQLSVLGYVNEHNSKHLQKLFEKYQNLLLPGSGEDRRETELERAKKALMEEVGKVFLVKKLSPGSVPKNLPPQLQDLATRQLADLERERLKELRKRRYRRMKRRMKGVRR